MQTPQRDGIGTESLRTVTKSSQTVTKECIVCGKSYEAKSNKAKFCTPSCKAKSFRNATRNEPQAHGEVSLVQELRKLEDAVNGLIRRVDVLEMRTVPIKKPDLKIGDDIPAVFTSTVYATRLGNMNPAMAAALAAPKKREFTYREIAIFNSYEEAKKKGGVYDSEQGFISFEDIPVPDGYEAFLLTKE